MSEKMLVIGESNDGELRNVTFEAIAAAKKIDPEGDITGLICGHGNLEYQANEMIYYGADHVVTVDHEKLAEYTSEGYSQAVMSVIEDLSPEVIVMGHTSIGKDLSPKLASKMETGLISDATSIDHDGDKPVFTRPIYSGKAFEKKVITDGLTFATIRPNNIAALARDESRTGTLIRKMWI
ncbi:Electron transfer flavoprotein subunit alpha [Lentibacillus sp. JNUCC-1]|nr:Electron transfer flavoprotein subunit alpha [Lentibacillus sp. JNUCC-1]